MPPSVIQQSDGGAPVPLPLPRIPSADPGGEPEVGWIEPGREQLERFGASIDGLGWILRLRGSDLAMNLVDGLMIRGAENVRQDYLLAAQSHQAPGLRIYVSGDGGYDGRFAEIAKKLGPVDWAIMDDGQYDKAWQSVHLLPEEVRQATLDLKARHLLPVHHSKITLDKHTWDEPVDKNERTCSVSALPRGNTNDRRSGVPR